MSTESQPVISVIITTCGRLELLAKALESLCDQTGDVAPFDVIVVDNVVRNGAVLDESTTDVNVQGVRRFMDTVAADNRVTATALQTVGSKGYDGFALLLVNS